MMATNPFKILWYLTIHYFRATFFVRPPCSAGSDAQSSLLNGEDYSNLARWVGPAAFLKFITLLDFAGRWGLGRKLKVDKVLSIQRISLLLFQCTRARQDFSHQNPHIRAKCLGVDKVSSDGAICMPLLYFQHAWHLAERTQLGIDRTLSSWVKVKPGV